MSIKYVMLKVYFYVIYLCICNEKWARNRQEGAQFYGVESGAEDLRSRSSRLNSIPETLSFFLSPETPGRWTRLCQVDAILTAAGKPLVNFASLLRCWCDPVSTSMHAYFRVNISKILDCSLCLFLFMNGLKSSDFYRHIWKMYSYTAIGPNPKLTRLVATRMIGATIGDIYLCTVSPI
jgi:hypothetical protein